MADAAIQSDYVLRWIGASSSVMNTLTRMSVRCSVATVFCELTDLVTADCNIVNQDSSVGIATAYGLDGPAIESRWGEIFRTCPDRP
jgi:hypothetical protein